MTVCVSPPREVDVVLHSSRSVCRNRPLNASCGFSWDSCRIDRAANTRYTYSEDTVLDGTAMPPRFLRGADTCDAMSEGPWCGLSLSGKPFASPSRKPHASSPSHNKKPKRWCFGRSPPSMFGSRSKSTAVQKSEVGGGRDRLDGFTWSFYKSQARPLNQSMQPSGRSSNLRREHLGPKAVCLSCTTDKVHVPSCVFTKSSAPTGVVCSYATDRV